MLTAALLLAACGRAPAPGKPDGPPPDLETAAIAAGVITDPKSADLSGLYARDTDRLCIVPTATSYRVGVFVDYGPANNCSASGTVTRAGETLRLSFPGDCAFDARFEGDRIVFPGRVPEGCQRLCTERGSLSALDVERLSDSVAEASALRDGKGRLLCGG